MHESSPGKCQASWLGTAGILLRTAETSILIDGFFTRPSLTRVAFGRLNPDREAIAAGLERAGIDRLDAVVTSHTHYDHALDALEIARQTGAVLFGSASLQQMARCLNFPENRMITAASGDHTEYGQIRLDWIGSRHNSPDRAKGSIQGKFSYPTHAGSMGSGQVFAIRILTPSGAVGILGSAGFLPGMFSNLPVSALFLSVAGLSRISEEERRSFFDQTVRSSRAKIIYPIHWDDFFRPIQQTPTILPRILDDVNVTMRQLETYCRKSMLDYRIPPFFQPFDPFSL